MPKIDNLKHCPFCRHTPELVQSENGWAIGCLNEECPVWVFTVEQDTIEAAVRVWNTRQGEEEFKRGLDLIRMQATSRAGRMPR